MHIPQFEGRFLLPQDMEIAAIEGFWASYQLPETLCYLVNFVTFSGNKCRSFEINKNDLDTSGFRLVSLRELLMNVSERVFEQASKAWQYVEFAKTHQYCGKCGAKSKIVEEEIASQCTSCEHRCYPRVSPCIIVCIRKGDQILLAQGVRHQSSGIYSTLAGFVESGETLEQAVQREVFEEVGIRVKNINYQDSQPWPFPHSLMCGFLADYESGEINPDRTEILEAHWYNIDQLPKTPPRVSIAGRLIDESIKQIQQSYLSK